MMSEDQKKTSEDVIFTTNFHKACKTWHASYLKVVIYVVILMMDIHTYLLLHAWKTRFEESIESIFAPIWSLHSNIFCSDDNHWMVVVLTQDTAKGGTGRRAHSCHQTETNNHASAH